MVLFCSAYQRPKQCSRFTQCNTCTSDSGCVWCGYRCVSTASGSNCPLSLLATRESQCAPFTASATCETSDCAGALPASPVCPDGTKVMPSCGRNSLGKCVWSIPPCPTASCTYNGIAYQIGQSFKSTDNCNTCTCSSNGLVACTKRFCVDPCESMRCIAGTKCVVNEYGDAECLSTGKPKPGSCPLVDTFSACQSTVDECSSDTDCPGNTICCDGCGYQCVDPAPAVCSPACKSNEICCSGCNDASFCAPSVISGICPLLQCNKSKAFAKSSQ